MLTSNNPNRYSGYAPPPPSGWPWRTYGTDMSLSYGRRGVIGASNAFQRKMDATGASLTQQDQEVIAMNLVAHNSRAIGTEMVPYGDCDLAGHIYQGLPCFGARDEMDVSSPGMMRIFSLPEFNKHLYRNRDGRSLTSNTRHASSIMNNFSYVGINSTVGEPNQDKSYSINAREVSQEFHGVTDRLTDIYAPAYEWFNTSSRDAVRDDVGYERPMAIAPQTVFSSTTLYLVLMPVSVAFVLGMTKNPFPTLRGLYGFSERNLYDDGSSDADVAGFMDGCEYYDRWSDTPFAKDVVASVGAPSVGAGDDDEFEAARPANRARRDNLWDGLSPFNAVTYSVLPFTSNSPTPPSPNQFVVSSKCGAPEARVLRIGSYSPDQKFFANAAHRGYDRIFASGRVVHDAVINPNSNHADFQRALPQISAVLWTTGH